MIRLDQARKLLKKAVDTQGRDFRYCESGSGCFYFKLEDDSVNCFGELVKSTPDDNRRKTGCLIGVALDLAGETRHHSFSESVDELALKYPDMMTPKAAQYFLRSQIHQDRGGTWGESYDMAEEYFNEYLNNSE